MVLRKVGIERLPYVITVNGATRWIGIGSFQLQPSELVKPALILWLARLLSERRRDLGTLQGLKPILLSSGVVGMLVLIGDDLGTTMLLGVIVLTMIFLAGAPVRVVGGIGALLATAAAFSLVFLESFRVTRIMAFLEPEKHLTGAGYQLMQSQIGLASGGVFGTGPGLSKAKWGFLPEAHTDFILAVIGEELGPGRQRRRDRPVRRVHGGGLHHRHAGPHRVRSSGRLRGHHVDRRAGDDQHRCDRRDAAHQGHHPAVRLLRRFVAVDDDVRRRHPVVRRPQRPSTWTGPPAM